MTTTSCPDDIQLMPLAHQDQVAEPVRDHVIGCPKCQRRVKQFQIEVAALRNVAASSSAFRTTDTAPPPLRRAAPAHIGPYVIKQELGSGGQGRVYLAYHPQLPQRDVAIKIGRPGLYQEEHNQALLAEGSLLVALKHEHIAQIHQLGLHEGVPYLVMEYVKGQNLAQRAKYASWTIEQKAALVAKIAKGIHAAHLAGIVHQDLKPENIVLDPQDEPQIIDFGLARVQTAWQSSLEATGGTAQYMPPEQASEYLTGNVSQEFTPERDIFSLGAVLYFLLTGVPPFDGTDVASRLRAAEACEFDKQRLLEAKVPRTLVHICLQAMSKDPNRRQSSALEVAMQLERCCRPRDGRWVLLLAAGLLLTVLVAGLIAAWPSRPIVKDQQQLVESILRSSDAPDPLTPRSLQEVAQALPLRDGDEIAFRCEVPAGYQAAAYLLNDQGQLQELPIATSTSRVGLSDTVRFPPQGSWSPTGMDGTVMVLFCARRGSRPALLEMQQALVAICKTPQDWPNPGIPRRTLLAFNHDQVKPLSGDNPRDVEQPKFFQVQEKVESLRQTLSQHNDLLLWGIVLPSKTAEM